MLRSPTRTHHTVCTHVRVGPHVKCCIIYPYAFGSLEPFVHLSCSSRGPRFDFSLVFNGRTAPPAAAPRRGGRRGRPTQ